MRPIDLDLKRTEEAARAVAADVELEELFGRQDLDKARITRALELVEAVAQSEADRETNLNAHGTAVASVAGVIVAVSSVVAQSGFEPASWTDWTKIAAVALFFAALVAVSFSMGVRRPTGLFVAQFLFVAVIGFLLAARL